MIELHNHCQCSTDILVVQRYMFLIIDVDIAPCLLLIL